MQRKRQPEVMDQPDLDPALHAAALRGLRRINWISRSSAILWPAIRDLARQHSGDSLRLLDVATGGGDIPIDLWHKARRAGFDLQVDGCDRNEYALEQARELAKQRGADVRFFAQDALGGPLPEEYDIVVCSLFLHHFDPSDAVVILRRMGLARRLVLVNDLRRGVGAWLLAWVGARILTRCRVVHIDGPLSVAGAYTCAEARDLAREAGLTAAIVRRRWPCRWLLEWHRN